MNTRSSTPLGGLWVPIVTPFFDDGSLDEGSLRRLAEQLLGAGPTGLVALGTTGEPATLTATERRTVVEVCADVCSSADRPLMVGAGTNSTDTTVDEVQNLTAELDVIKAVLIVSPYYTRPSPAAVIDHFGHVADASPVPVVIYNIPYRTGVALSGRQLLAAGDHANIVGLKQAVGALDADTLSVLAGTGDHFEVLAGDDAFIAPTMLMGGAGAIAAAAHLCTHLFADMVAAASGSNPVRAATLSHALMPVVTAGFAEPSPAVWKGALASTGVLTSPRVRRPLTPASPDATQRLLDAAARATATTA